MGLLISLAAIALIYHLWSRLNWMDSVVVQLTERVHALEQQRAPQPVRPPVPAKPPVPTPVPPAPAIAPAAATTHPEYVVSGFSRTDEVRLKADATFLDPAADADSLESRIGSRWLLYVGVAAIIIGVSYFEKLAIESRWIGETARVIQGGVLGLVLVGTGLRFVKKGYQLYGRVLAGCGIGILYISTYAAVNLYHLINRPTAFALMSMVTLLAALLADRQRAQSLAIVAVSGGFATPFLIPSPSDAHIAFLTYEAILIGSTLFLARRRDRPQLNIISYALTVLTTAAWAGDAYQPSIYLSTELFFTLFCVMFLFVLHESAHSQHPLAPLARTVLWSAPPFYYAASLLVLGPHSPALLTYLILLSMAGAGTGLRGATWARLTICIATVAPLLLWSGSPFDGMWPRAGLATWAAVYAIYLAALLHSTIKKDGAFGNAEVALLHLNSLGAYAGAYLLLRPLAPTASAPVAAAFALWHATLAFAVFKRCREEALHFVAVAFTLLTVAVGLRWEGAWVAGAWAAEGVALTCLALRERRDWLRAAGIFLFAIGVFRLLDLQASEPLHVEQVLWNGRAACGLFIAALAYAAAFAHHRLSDPATRHTETGIALVIAKLVLLSVALSEILWYWKRHPGAPFEPASQAVAAAITAGAAIMWTGLARRQEWMRGIGAMLLAIGGMLLLPAQLTQAPIGYVTLLNGRAGAGIFAVAVLYLLSFLHNRLGRHVPDLPMNVAALTIAASLFTLSLLSSEINAYWSEAGNGGINWIAREGVQTIVWASIGTFLMWRGLLSSRGWVRGAGAAILLMAVLRLFRLEFADAGPGYLIAANARVAAGVVVIVLLYALAYLYRNAGPDTDAQLRPFILLMLSASVLTLSLFTSEIAAASSDSSFAREMMMSVTWAGYATLLIIAGLKKHFAPIRYFAMAVFVITIIKVFVIDLAELQRIYRVLSIVGLGVALLLSSYVYQRFTTSRE
jgi:uncharacterized membrane protein